MHSFKNIKRYCSIMRRKRNKNISKNKGRVIYYQVCLRGVGGVRGGGLARVRLGEGVGIFVGDLLGGWRSETINPWSRDVVGSYIFLGIMEGQNSVFIKTIAASGGFAPRPVIICTFSVSILSDLEQNEFRFSLSGEEGHHILRWLLESFCESLHW